MRKLISLPPNLVDKFHSLTGHSRKGWFVTSDPVGARIGSGGGSAWLLDECRRNEGNPGGSREEWLAKEKRILLHAGGQSRRLPAYAPSGKILTPIPIFRWKRGQSLSQTLLDVQMPLYERIMEIAPDGVNTLIASGDVYIHADAPLKPLPKADVICYGLWVDPEIARNHGVYVVDERTGRLDFMAQKPPVERQAELMRSHLLLMDIGIWMLSDRAVELLCRRSTDPDGSLRFYDLYSDFGLALGDHPVIPDAELNALTVAILPLDGGRFFHFGTSPDIIRSMLAIQNLVSDQREIFHRHVKPHPAMFVQNARIDIPLTADNSDIWIENSHIGPRWQLTRQNIVTGVPANDWVLRLGPGVCIDIAPIGADAYVCRPYGFSDKFKGAVSDPQTALLDRPLAQWLAERGLTPADISADPATDIQFAPLFPVVTSLDDAGRVINWMVSDPSDAEGRRIWLESERLSADAISERADLARLAEQRSRFRNENYAALARNYRHSVFLQSDLASTAADFARAGLSMPEPIAATEPAATRIADAMFRARLCELRGEDSSQYEAEAFGTMRKGLLSATPPLNTPRLSVYSDQIVWSRSPVRIDLAGGWTDTPPYSILEGGNVVNIAIELNGQPPLQAYVKPSSDLRITLRSIDLGATETVETYEQLADYRCVGSPFSIPKAALSLAGFLPQFCPTAYLSLRDQLEDFGCGIEITLLSAVPAGSGLGTSSILASTVLGAINDFCRLGWDNMTIGRLTLQLEQLLTTGGGWQDQFGGILHGVKLLQTTPGWEQTPVTRWLPDRIFTDAEVRPCHLLYYTGITRTAKNILAEIVKGMFLNENRRLAILDAMKQHALDMRDAIQLNRFEEYGRLVRKTWSQNCRLDAGTNPAAVRAITDRIDDLCLGYKLPGAGGGGYLYMVAKDLEAASRIRRMLTESAPNPRARFVEMSLSSTGLETSRS